MPDHRPALTSQTALLLATAPLMWELTRETLTANFNPEFQQWWLSTGLRSLTIERDFYRDLTYSESRLQRFSIRGVTATATWRCGRLGNDGQ